MRARFFLKAVCLEFIFFAALEQILWAEETSAQSTQTEETSEDSEDEDLSTLSGGIQTDQVLLRGLNKVTARVSDILVFKGEAAKFGNLEITARLCQKAPPEDPPESTAYLEIQEIKPGEGRRAVFSGWMFASSPEISALEHPVYDVWVLECQGQVLYELPAMESGIPMNKVEKDFSTPKAPSSPVADPTSAISDTLKAFKRGFDPAEKSF